MLLLADALLQGIKNDYLANSWWPTFLINFTLLFTKLPIKKDSPVKYIIYMFPDIRSKSKELAIYSVEDCLEEISFSWILTIKEVKKLKIKRSKQLNMIDSLQE